MKFIHLSDLHLGKRIYETSLIEDQRYILKQILEIIDNEKPDGILIAGDIYDKAVMPSDAVRLFDDFLYQLHSRLIPVYIISGNHDSADRLAFGSQILSRQDVYIAPPYQGEIYKVELRDTYGTLNIFMLPFVKKALIRSLFPEEEIETMSDAIKCVIDHTSLKTDDRNILIAHQYITNSKISDSEEYAVGGADNVDAIVFDDFDYVALGHIHGPQPAGRNTIRYCGTPLKYSFSEADHEKSVTIVECREKGSVMIHTAPLIPFRDMKEIKGKYAELIRDDYLPEAEKNDFLHVILTDEDDIPDAASFLRKVYPNYLHLDYDNTRTRSELEGNSVDDIEKKTPNDLFAEFFELQNGRPLEPELRKTVDDLIEKIWREEA